MSGEAEGGARLSWQALSLVSVWGQPGKPSRSLEAPPLFSQRSQRGEGGGLRTRASLHCGRRGRRGRAAEGRSAGAGMAAPAGPLGAVNAGHPGWGASAVHGHGSPLPACWRSQPGSPGMGGRTGQGSGRWAPSLPGRLPGPGCVAMLALGRLRHSVSRKFMVIAAH